MLAPENRSRLMPLIRGRNNETTELRLAALLRGANIKGWRRHLPLSGRPDFTFLRERMCVFVHGCFWHGCPTCYLKPRSNSSFWVEKLSRNKARDRRVVRQLRTLGYSTLTVWECSLVGKKSHTVLRRISRQLQTAHVNLGQSVAGKMADPR